MMNKRMKVCAQRRFQHNVKSDSEYSNIFCTCGGKYYSYLN